MFVFKWLATAVYKAVVWIGTAIVSAASWSLAHPWVALAVGLASVGVAALLKEQTWWGAKALSSLFSGFGWTVASLGITSVVFGKPAAALFGVAQISFAQPWLHWLPLVGPIFQTLQLPASVNPLSGF